MKGFFTTPVSPTFEPCTSIDNPLDILYLIGHIACMRPDSKKGSQDADSKQTKAS